MRNLTVRNPEPKKTCPVQEKNVPEDKGDSFGQTPAGSGKRSLVGMISLAAVIPIGK